jgi:hypothetical protein
MKVARMITGFVAFAAFFISWLFVFTLSNRLRISRNQDQYLPATFAVNGAAYYPAQGKGFDSYWLTGSVAGATERFIPKFLPKFNPESADELLTIYPRGSQIDVLYNAHETETIIQGETLRVLHYTPNFWREQERLRNKLLCFVLLPTPLALGIYITFRHLHMRQLKMPNPKDRFER